MSYCIQLLNEFRAFKFVKFKVHSINTLDKFDLFRCNFSKGLSTVLHAGMCIRFNDFSRLYECKIQLGPSVENIGKFSFFTSIDCSSSFIILYFMALSSLHSSDAFD